MQANNWASGEYDLVLSLLKSYDYTVSDKATEETLRKTIEDYKTLGLVNKNEDTGVIMERIWHPVLAE